MMKRSHPPFDPHDPDEGIDRRIADFLRREAERRVQRRRSDDEVVAAIRRIRPHRRRGVILGALGVAAILVVGFGGAVYFGSAVKPLPAPPASAAPSASPAPSYPAAKLPPATTPTLAPEIAWATVNLAGTFPGGGLWAMQGSSYLVSTDAGTTWVQTALRTAAPQNEQDVAVLDTAHAWYVAVGPGSTPVTGSATDVLHLLVYHTGDGGRTWQTSAVPGNYPETSQSLVFVDPEHGYLLCSAERFSSGMSTVLATSDGGATWHIVGTSTWLGSMLAASGPSTLWAGAQPEAGPVAHPLLAVSRDGGRSWQDVSLPGLGTQSGGALAGPPDFTDSSMGFVTVGSLLFRTTDAGRSWTKRGELPSQASTGPVLLDATHWLAPLLNPLGLAATSDAGATWDNLASSGLGGIPHPGWFAWMGGIDATHAAALVPTGNTYPGETALYLTADGGQSWHPADVVGVAADSLATPFSRCPSAPLSFDPNATSNAIAAARAAVPALYKDIDTIGYQVRTAAPATESLVAGFGAIAGSLCGQLTQSRTYVIELRFPAMEPSASLSQGQLFVSRLAAGWQVWYQYH